MQTYVKNVWRKKKIELQFVLSKLSQNFLRRARLIDVTSYSSFQFSVLRPVNCLREDYSIFIFRLHYFFGCQDYFLYFQFYFLSFRPPDSPVQILPAANPPVSYNRLFLWLSRCNLKRLMRNSLSALKVV